jgi:hypothetical protein
MFSRPVLTPSIPPVLLMLSVCTWIESDEFLTKYAFAISAITSISDPDPPTTIFSWAANGATPTPQTTNPIIASFFIVLFFLFLFPFLFCPRTQISLAH